MLKFVDEIAWIAATLDYPEFNFVTVAMDRVEFHRSVRTGTILRFHCEQTKIGRTSVRYHVEVFRANVEPDDSGCVFATNVTMVRVDDKGQKLPIAAS